MCNNNPYPPQYPQIDRNALNAGNGGLAAGRDAAHSEPYIQTPAITTPETAGRTAVQPATSSISYEPDLAPRPNLPELQTGYEYIPGFLRAHIGALLRVEFLIADRTTSRVGRLREVGANYLVLESLDGNSRLMGELYSVRFVTILDHTTPNTLAENAFGSGLSE